MGHDNNRGLVLKWQKALIKHLVEDNPKSHSSILVVAMVLVSYANPDGSRVWPSQETIARDAGLSVPTVKVALAYLVEHGFHRVRGESEAWHSMSTGWSSLTLRCKLSCHLTGLPRVLRSKLSWHLRGQFQSQVRYQIQNQIQTGLGQPPYLLTSLLQSSSSLFRHQKNWRWKEVRVWALSRLRRMGEEESSREGDRVRLLQKILAEDQDEYFAEKRRRSRDASTTSTAENVTAAGRRPSPAPPAVMNRACSWTRGGRRR